MRLRGNHKVVSCWMPDCCNTVREFGFTSAAMSVTDGGLIFLSTTYEDSEQDRISPSISCNNFGDPSVQSHTMIFPSCPEVV